jgi:hypothetical protein
MLEGPSGRRCGTGPLHLLVDSTGAEARRGRPMAG